jgi:hypothetical protein
MKQIQQPLVFSCFFAMTPSTSLALHEHAFHHELIASTEASKEFLDLIAN